MEKLLLHDFISMWRHALQNVTERSDEFSRLDAVTGDGDHGTAIVQALASVVEASENGSEYRSMLGDMGFNVMMQTSGSTSTLTGAFLLGMSDHSEGQELTAGQVKKMFRGGLEGVQKQTQAKTGDKTFMDALIPAVEAMEQSEGEDIRKLFASAAEAARVGAEATTAMKANFGRARNYGERSVGTPDAGAMSWACIFTAFDRYLSGDR